MTEEGFQKSFDYFNQALEEDPTYALAYSGLSGLYSKLGFFNLLSPQDTFPKAKAAVLKALELNDNLAEAHEKLADVIMLYDWDWLSAERELKRAIELNPNLVEAHAQYSYYFAIMGRKEECIEEVERTLDLDPLSPFYNTYMCVMLIFARQYDQVIARMQESLKLHPNNYTYHSVLGRAYSLKGMHDKAIEEMEKAVILSGGKMPMELMMQATVFASAGHREDALKILNKMLEQSKTRYVSPASIGLIYLKLGQIDTAFEWFEKAFDIRDFWIVHLKAAPEFESISSDPRFKALLKKVGLE
jgi:tetratricopeptide (TPR) repeat protein